MSVEVPLVVYEDGVRKVIGVAVVENDGSYTAKPNKDESGDFSRFLLGTRTGHYSLVDKDFEVSDETKAVAAWFDHERFYTDSRLRASKNANY